MKHAHQLIAIATVASCFMVPLASAQTTDEEFAAAAFADCRQLSESPPTDRAPNGATVIYPQALAQALALWEQCQRIEDFYQKLAVAEHERQRKLGELGW
jgi:hypothetical protein